MQKPRTTTRVMNARAVRERVMAQFSPSSPIDKASRAWSSQMIESLQMMLVAPRLGSLHAAWSSQMMESADTASAPHVMDVPQMEALSQIMLVPPRGGGLFTSLACLV